MGIDSKYEFKIGKIVSQKKADGISDYLNAAEDIHGYLEECKVETTDGIFWRDPDFTFNTDSVVDDLSIYSGSSGITYLYLELYKATKKEEYKVLVLSSADYLDVNWKNQMDIAHSFLGSLVKSKLVGCGITIGISSIGMVLSVIYHEFGREKDLQAIKDITSYVIENAEQEDDLLYWTGKTSAIFDAGIVLYLFKINEILNDDTVLNAAVKGADMLVKKAIVDERGGYRWTSFVESVHLPNYDGTAGTAYVLSVAYQKTGDKKYLHAALQGVRMVKALAVKKDNAMLIPFQDVEGSEDIFYMSTCNGPAGTSRVFYNLYKITGNEEYLEDIRALYRGMRYMQVPEKQSKGYWNTTCICCGTAGVLQYAINYYNVFQDEDSKNVAITAGNILLDQKEKRKNGAAWPMAFERVNPTKITRSIAFETGSSGNAAALLQLYLFLTNKYDICDQLFDDPF